MVQQKQTGNPAPDEPGSVSAESIVRNIIALTSGSKILEQAIKDRAAPYAERLRLLQEEMDADLAELRAQSDKMKIELAEDKAQLADNWPGSTGRIERNGWTIDRKERKGVNILSEELLMARVQMAVEWKKQPYKISWNKTALAKLLDAGVIFKDLVEPTVTVSVAVTPPKEAGL